MKNILVLIPVLLGLVVNAQKPAVISGDEKGWYHIGKVSASLKSERESIVVMGNDEFQDIRLRVEDAPIKIERLQVFFEGGKVQDIDVKQPLKAGEETKEFELKADNKEIDKVVFYYQTIGNENGERASVELYGYKAYSDGESAGIRQRDEAGTNEDIDDIGDKINEQASTLNSEITDRESDDKVGPNGQQIYIDENSNYYYVDDQGDRVLVPASELKDKE